MWEWLLPPSLFLLVCYPSYEHLCANWIGGCWNGLQPRSARALKDNDLIRRLRKWRVASGTALGREFMITLGRTLTAPPRAPQGWKEKSPPGRRFRTQRA